MPLSFGGRTFNIDIPAGVKDTVGKLNDSANKTLKIGTDSCNIMGTIGAITPDITTAITAAETEEKTTEMLEKLSSAAGQLKECTAEVETVTNTATSKMSTVNDLVSRLQAAGKTELATKLENAFITYMDAVEGKVGLLDVVAGPGAQVPVLDDEGNPTYDEFGTPVTTDIGTAIETGVAKMEEKLGECEAKLGEFVTAGGGLNCKKIQEAMLNTTHDPNGNAGEVSKTVKSKVPRHTRRMQDNGTLVNFNINRKKPYRDVVREIQVRNLDAAENEDPFETKEVLVRIYGDQAVLDKHLGKKVEDIPKEPDIPAGQMIA